MAEIVIHDRNATSHLDYTDPNGERKAKGLIPRDYKRHPVGYSAYAKPFDLPLIPEGEWEDRLADLTAHKALLSDVRNRGMNGRPIPSRDQDGKGYCWAHSSTSAILIVRAFQGEPYADLSAFAVACQIKNFHDEGGWGAESLEWIASKGIPDSKYWPQQSMDRSNVNDAMKANSLLHRFTDWRDLDPDHMRAQYFTSLLSGNPVVSDYNFWSHSVCSLDPVHASSQWRVTRADSGKLLPWSEFTKVWCLDDATAAGWGCRLWNSWADSWSENGTGLLTPSKAVPDGALVALVATASAA